MTAIEHKPSKSNPMDKGGPCEITIDLETIPSQLPQITDYLLKNIAPDSRLKDPVKIEADIAKKQHTVLDKAGLEGFSCHIICLGAKIDDHPAVTFSTDSWEKERDIIIEFFNYIVQNCGNYAHTYIGHALQGFDFKVLRQRCMVLGIKWPFIFDSSFTSRFPDSVYDTMLKWNGGDKHDYISLEKLCLAFGIETPKEDMTGADVYKYWKAGRIKEIAEYCQRDCEASYGVYRCMTMSF